MSKTLSRTSALEDISNWTTSDVLSLLRKNGLDDCCKAVEKRQVDGDQLLHLTEGKLALWKSDLTRPLTWGLWTLAEEVRRTPEKYVAEKNAMDTQSEETMSDSGSWGTDFEDDVDEFEADDGVSISPSKNNINNNNNVGNATTGVVCSQNSEYHNRLMLFRESEKTSVTQLVAKDKSSRTSRIEVTESTYTNCETDVDPPEDESTYANCGPSETRIAAMKNMSTLDSVFKKSLAEQLKEQLRLRNERKPSIRPKPKILTTKPEMPAKKQPQKSFLHDVVPVLQQHGLSEKSLVTTTEPEKRKSIERSDKLSIVTTVLEKRKSIERSDKSWIMTTEVEKRKSIERSDKSSMTTTEVEKRKSIERSDKSSMTTSEPEKTKSIERTENDLPRPPVMIQNFDLVANLPTRIEESEDEYETFDEQIIEQNKRLSLGRVDSKQSLSSLHQSSVESVYKTPSTASQDKQEEEDEIYESITETPEDDDCYLQPIERGKTVVKAPPPLPAKTPNASITPSPTPSRSGEEKKAERSPDKKSATLPHSGSGTSLSAELRATRPLPPPPDKQSYMDSPWFHNITREQATALIKDRAYGNAQNGYFLFRPSTSQPNNPLALVLWFKDRVYNVAVRKRPDNRFALGSAKVNEQSFASVEDIVKFYSREELVLHTGGVQTGSTKLTDTPPK